MSNKSKNLLLNYYKSKISNKVHENSIFNNIYSKYSNLNSSRKESSKDKNRFNSKKNKTTKNSPNSSLILNSKEFSFEKNKIKFKNDLLKNKEGFKDNFIKKINAIDKNDKGNISHKQNISKNIFNMYNSIRNGSALISNRLVKNRKTTNLISNINLNNINNSNMNAESRFIINEINNSTNNKSLYNNYKNNLNERISFKNKLYNFNVGGKKSYIMDFKKLNKDIKKNTINNSFLKKYIINTNKVKENNPKLENTFNTKIRKVSSIDYLYNNKTKKTEKKNHHINYINDNKSDFNISERIKDNKIGENESGDLNLSNRNININKFINKSTCNNFITKKDNTIKNKLNNNKQMIRTSNKNIYDIKFNDLENNSSSLISENYLIKSIQYISNNNNCNNINNQNISINININNHEDENNFIQNIKKDRKKSVKNDENEINNNKERKFSIKISEDNNKKKSVGKKDEIRLKKIRNLNDINNFIINGEIKENKDDKNNKKEKDINEKNFMNDNSEEKFKFKDKEKLNITKKLKEKKSHKENNINEKRDFSPIYEEDLNIKEHINKLNQFNINKNNVNSSILLKIKNENKNENSFNQINFREKINNKIFLEDEQNKKKNHSISIGLKKKDIKNINNEKENSKIEIKNYKLIDLKEFQSSKNIFNDIPLDKKKEKKDKIIFDPNNNNNNNKSLPENNKRNKNKSKEKDKYKNTENDMLYIPDSYKIEKDNKQLSILTLTRDSSFFKEKLCELSLYIRNYYKENKKYPKSNIDFYLYGREIGSGAFGKVNIALHIGSGRLVAIKIFEKKKLKTERKKRKIKNEIDILSRLRHPFINQILDTFDTEKYIFIVMEYICADLLSFIRKREKLSENISKIIFKQIIEGLKYINKKNIVHRDIKLDNILIDLTNTVKICDFGVSKRIQENELMIDHCGTPGYIAPEIYKNKGYEGFQCDIWSAGVTLYYMLSGSQPFRAYSLKDMEKKVVKGDFEEIKDISDEANDLIKKMLVVDPDKRITINEILNHPWLKDENVENRKNLKLFTDNEKILLSKYDVNYLSSNKEELIENFTIKNLDTMNDEDEKLKNRGNTKSIIFSPFNSYVDESNSCKKNSELEIKKIYDELKIENNICKYALVAQQENIKYQLSNNNDFDNGIIKTQKEEDIEKENQEIKRIYGEQILDKITCFNKYRSSNNSFEFKDNYIDEEIIKKIEENIGYNSEYVINCIKKNKINYETATYYLLLKEKQEKQKENILI